METRGRGQDLAISSITYGELMVGILKKDSPRRRAALRKVLAPMTILPFDRDAGIEFARIKADLEQSGEVIGPYDLQIAGHAVASGRRLVTHNGTEFSRVKDLDWVDWEAEADDA